MPVWQQMSSHPPTGNSSRRRRSLAACARGSSLVEFALVAPLLLLLFFSMFEFGRLFFTRLTVRHAVIEATRFAVTGSIASDPETGDPLDRVRSIQQTLQTRAMGLPIALDDIEIDPADGGGPEDVVRVTLTYTYTYSLPGFDDVLPDLRFAVSTAMRNEPYFETGSPTAAVAMP